MITLDADEFMYVENRHVGRQVGKRGRDVGKILFARAPFSNDGREWGQDGKNWRLGCLGSG